MNMKQKHKRALVYCRTATNEQNRNNSIARQEVMCRQFAKDRNYKIVEVISEVASGMTLNRKGFKRLMTIVKQGKVDVICVASICRLTRNFANCQKLYGQLVSHNIGLDIAGLSTAHRSRQ